jgi:hypothetical protein
VVRRSCDEGAGDLGSAVGADKLSADEVKRPAVSLALTEHWGALRGAFRRFLDVMTDISPVNSDTDFVDPICKCVNWPGAACCQRHISIISLCFTERN